VSGQLSAISFQLSASELWLDEADAKSTCPQTNRLQEYVVQRATCVYAGEADWRQSAPQGGSPQPMRLW
jgi:hypothetical protein